MRPRLLLVSARGLAATLAASAVAVTALAPSPAHAAVPLGKKTKTYSYSKGYCFYSKPLKKAMQVKLDGKLRYMRHAYKFNRGIRVRFHDPKLVNPTIRLTTKTKCGGKTSGVSKSKVVQTWYDWKCSSSVQILLGQSSKFGVSFSGTRTCGKVRVASRATGYGKGSSFTQYNSGAPVGWNWGKDGKGIDKGGKICLHVDAGGTAYVGNKSDTVMKPLNVCVPASYS